jgi:small-conductance mechanosensitive channel
MVALLLYIPLLRILPGMIGKLFIIPFYGFLTLYFYHCVSILFFKSMLVTRVELLIIPLLMILLLASAVKKYNSLAGDKKVKSRLLVFITTGAVILFIVTLFTNIIGHFYISELFNSATLNSIYTTMIMVVSILIIESILMPIVRYRKVKSINIIRRSIEFWERRGEVLIKISAVVIWLVFVLSQFSVFTFVEDWITETIAHRWVFGMVEISLGDILLFFITFSVSILIAKFLRYSLEEDVLTRMQLSPGIAFSVSIVVYYIILLLGFFLAVTSAGFDLDKLTILIGALGVGIGFGLQTLVNNFISGLILIFERPIKVGDVIEVGSLSGKVLRIGIRASSIRTFDGAEVIVPNGNLISAELVNWTRSDQLRRMEILVGVAYGTKPERVIEILEKIPLNHPDVLKETPPVVLFKGFGESSLNFSLMFWTSNFDKWGSIQSDVTKSVNNALAAEGIEIPFPRRDVHLTQNKSSSADSKIAE